MWLWLLVTCDVCCMQRVTIVQIKEVLWFKERRLFDISVGR